MRHRVEPRETRIANAFHVRQPLQHEELWGSLNSGLVQELSGCRNLEVGASEVQGFSNC